MQKKILFFLVTIFLFVPVLSVVAHSSDDIDQSIIFDDDITLDDIVNIEHEMFPDQCQGLSYKDQVEMVKFALANPSFTLDYLKRESQNAPKKLDNYFSHNKKAYMVTITVGAFLIILALGFKIITEKRAKKKG